MVYKGYAFKDSKAKATRILSRVAGSQQKVDDDELTSAVENMLKVREAAYKDMIKLIKGAQKLGMTNRQIRESLKAAKVSKQDTQMMLKGRIPPWKMSKTFIQTAKARAVIRRVDEEERKEIALEFQRRKRLIRDVIHR